MAVPKVRKTDRKQKVTQALKDAGLTDYHQRPISSLSGGERARVSLMRTLLAQPKALLLDEPFSALDASRREQIRQFTFDTIRERQLPTILVTHDAQDIPEQFNDRIIHLSDN
jgi:putative thiamine transport system ATP-binding protein